MNCPRTIRLILAWLLLGSTPLLSAQERIGIGLDRNQVMIGDPIQFKVEVQLPPEARLLSLDLNFDEAQLDAPAFNTTPGAPAEAPPEAPDLELRSTGRWLGMADTANIVEAALLDWDTLTAGSTTILVNELGIIPWDAGLVTLASVALDFEFRGERRQLLSNVLELRVGSPEAPSATAAMDSLGIAPIKDIRQEPLNWRDFLPWALGVLGAILLILLIRYVVRRPQPTGPPPPQTRRVAVHRYSLDKLEALKKRQLWQQGQVKEYQSELTFIVREYLENRYGIQALESTTAEILTQLQFREFATEQQTRLQEMFQLADMVKFAKAIPEATMHGKLMENAEGFIRQTQPAALTEESEEGWLEVPI
ncbi:MAG: hypothetical protein AAFR05_04525 [Bacteroidota bacterium]